jgi:hypothetical protein
LDFDPMVRVKTAMRVSELVERKTGLRRSLDQSDDDFLEKVARETRDQARFRRTEETRRDALNSTKFDL